MIHFRLKKNQRFLQRNSGNLTTCEDLLETLSPSGGCGTNCARSSIAISSVLTFFARIALKICLERFEGDAVVTTTRMHSSSLQHLDAPLYQQAINWKALTARWMIQFLCVTRTI